MKPTNESVPTAQAGGAQAYRASLYQYRLQEGDHPQPGPVATLFGQYVTGESSLMSGFARQAYSSTVVIEWIVEAGKRLWIVRLTQEQPAGTVDLSSASSLLASLHSLTMSSKILTHPTTVEIKKSPSVRANATLSSLPFPSWWNGTCDVNNHSGSFALTTWTATGLIACGPLGGTHCVSFGGSSCVYEWQCVELVKRYFVLANLANAYPANGDYIVQHYPNSKMAKYTGDGSQQLSINGKPFQAGDVLSWADMNVQTNLPDWSSAGHTAIVTSVTSSSFTVIEENVRSPAVLSHLESITGCLQIIDGPIATVLTGSESLVGLIRIVVGVLVVEIQWQQ